MVGKGLEMPQYIGCQHHILDRILKHVLDTYGSKTTTKPSLNYKFIDELLENYKELQSEYKAETEMDVDENPGWRDDFKFLYELCKAFQHCKKHAAFPVIKWRKLPSLHIARWNSRAIYTLIAYFLLPSWGSVLELPACFIAEKWQETWFSTQKFKETTYDNLLLGITKLGCASALKCLKTHWSRAPSVLDVPRSNMIAKRAVKMRRDEFVGSGRGLRTPPLSLTYPTLSFITRRPLQYNILYNPVPLQYSLLCAIFSFRMLFLQNR
ncbi:hypothetical protein GWK47_031335 [Chionoecetes opilio]|uniref:Uncharacterized protein n=1 Tax=Chionoecetes opilio TaxID=41210 RepID=A0A8J5D4B8_CHIOP|nr:hypothetical protein GWK47_031335 [Chionoecetes opilio]